MKQQGINTRKRKDKLKKPKFAFNILDEELKGAEKEFDLYLNTIVRYLFIDECTSGDYFHNLYFDLLTDGLEDIDKSKKTEKEKYELKKDLIHLFDKENDGTEDGIKKSKIKYYKKLSSYAKSVLSNSSDEEKKKEIIEEGIKQKLQWSEQFNRNSELYKKLGYKK